MLRRNRFYATSAEFPKITTHYTVVQREKDERWKDVNMERFADEADLLIVGGGPAGMSAAIRAKQVAAAQGKVRFFLVQWYKIINFYIFRKLEFV